MSSSSVAASRNEAIALPEPRRRLTALTLGALGVVYGDIGTSPLYTVKEVFLPATGVPLDAPHLVGAISLIVWALMLVVTLKYVILVLRADNGGEGGVLALATLAARAVNEKPRLRAAMIWLGMAGAALFYGDSVITPAITVLGAMEGLQILSPSLQPLVVPAALAIIVLLFAAQRFGTAAVGRVFGPVIVIWFIVLAVIGVVQIARQPAILAALDPRHAVAFLADRQGWQLLATIGAVVLALTGAEALYADLGHFGRRPIRIAWSGLVLPALALNYIGQGALLMHDPAAIDNPFYRLFPEAWLVPVLLLATLAAIIASQAVISGAYSLTQQAVQLGLLPRLAVRFTSAREPGQIYMPAVNWVLLVAVCAAIVGFGSASALGGAYGIAVTLTMLITTVLTYFVVRRAWRLPAAVAIGATAFFLALDAWLVAGCAIKLFDGGWMPIALGLAIAIAMSTWWRGRALMLERLSSDGVALEAFVAALDASTLHRAGRTAVYPVADPSTVPLALLHNLKHNQVLHERNLVVTVRFATVPHVDEAERLEVRALGNGFWCVEIRYGFMQAPDVPRALAGAAAFGLPVPTFETSYFLSRETVVPSSAGRLMRWREQLFAAMSRNASGVVAFFRLPDNAVVELGSRVQL